MIKHDDTTSNYVVCYVYRKNTSDFTILAPNDQALSKKKQ